MVLFCVSENDEGLIVVSGYISKYHERRFLTMYRPDTYDIHNSTLDSFAALFNSCESFPELTIRPIEQETGGNDGYLYLNNVRLFGFDWERRDNYFHNGVFPFPTLGQYERKIQKNNIELSIQCDSQGEVLVAGWHDDFRREEPVTRQIATSDPDSPQNNAVLRYTEHFHVYHYATEMAQLKRDLLTALYTNCLDHTSFDSTADSGLLTEFARKFGNCPRCHSEMILRRNRNSGEWFLGCTGFPDCRTTISLR